MNKKLLLILSLIAFSFASKAQIRFGLKAGVNFANVTISSGGISLSPSSITAIQTGIILESRVAEKVVIQPNLLLSTKGFSLSSTKVNYDYIELPINVLYEAGHNFTIGGGPYLAYAFQGSSETNDISTDIKFGGSGGPKRFDYGLNFTIGYEVIDGFILNANYSLGIENIIDTNSGTAKNNVIGLSLTRFFGKR